MPEVRVDVFDIAIIGLIIFSLVLSFFHYIALFCAVGLALIVIVAKKSNFFKAIGIALGLVFLTFVTFEAVLFPAYYIPPSVAELLSLLRGMNYFVISAFTITIIFIGIIATVSVGLAVKEKQVLDQWLIICVLLLIFAVFDALWFPFLLSDPNTALILFIFHTTIYFICFTISFFFIYVTAKLITRGLQILYSTKKKFVASVNEA